MARCKGKTQIRYGTTYQSCRYEGIIDGFCRHHHPDSIEKRKLKQRQRISEMLKKHILISGRSQRVQKIHQEIYRYLQSLSDPRAQGFVHLLQDDGVI